MALLAFLLDKRHRADHPAGDRIEEERHG